MIDWKKILTNQFTIIFVFVALALFGIWYWGRQTGKNKVLRNVSELPNSGSGIPAVGIDKEGKLISWDPTPLAQEAKDVLTMWAWTESKNAWLDKVSALTDDQLAALYNKFSALYITEGWGTLYDHINETTFGLFDDRKDKLIARMNVLKLMPAPKQDRKLFGLI